MELEEVAKQYILAYNAFINSRDKSISEHYHNLKHQLHEAAIAYQGPKTNISKSVRLWALTGIEVKNQTKLLPQKPNPNDLQVHAARMKNWHLAEENMHFLLRKIFCSE